MAYSMLFDAFQELLDNRTATLMVMDDRLDELCPIRRRTAIGLISLDEPCYQTMAMDIYDYVKEFPEHEEAALKDLEVLLKASSGGLNFPLSVFWWQR